MYRLHRKTLWSTRVTKYQARAAFINEYLNDLIEIPETTLSGASEQLGAGSAAAVPTFGTGEKCSPESLSMWQTDGDD